MTPDRPSLLHPSDAPDGRCVCTGTTWRKVYLQPWERPFRYVWGCSDCGRNHPEGIVHSTATSAWDTPPGSIGDNIEAAVERAARAICENGYENRWEASYEVTREWYRQLAREALRAAGETP